MKKIYNESTMMVLAIAIGMAFLFMSSIKDTQANHNLSDTFLALALDYELEQNCIPYCKGMVDFIKHFEYDLNNNVIYIDTHIPYVCEQDGILLSSFEQTVKVVLNDRHVGTLKNLEYDTRNNVVWINTHELNFNCEVR